MAAGLAGLPDDADFEGFAEAVRDIVAGAEHPLAAAEVSAASMKVVRERAARRRQIFGLWLSDLALAQRLDWDAPVPLLATTIAHASLRRGAVGTRPRSGRSGLGGRSARAYALAAQEAFVLAGELSRLSERCWRSTQLRAKGAGRVVELLLGDDAVSPARAAKHARLSDRAARRLFDRLIELDAARELSGRLSFRLYGL